MYLIWQGGGIKINKCCVSVVRDVTQMPLAAILSFKKNFIEVWLLYNVVLLSTVQ